MEGATERLGGLDAEVGLQPFVDLGQAEVVDRDSVGHPPLDGREHPRLAIHVPLPPTR